MGPPVRLTRPVREHVGVLMVLLRCFDRFDQLARLDGSGGLSLEPTSEGRSIDGLYSSPQSGMILALYRKAGRLVLRVDQHA